MSRVAAARIASRVLRPSRTGSLAAIVPLARSCTDQLVQTIAIAAPRQVKEFREILPVVAADLRRPPRGVPRAAVRQQGNRSEQPARHPEGRQDDGLRIHADHHDARHAEGEGQAERRRQRHPSGRTGDRRTCAWPPRGSRRAPPPSAPRPAAPASRAPARPPPRRRRASPRSPPRRGCRRARAGRAAWTGRARESAGPGPRTRRRSPTPPRAADGLDHQEGAHVPEDVGHQVEEHHGRPGGGRGGQADQHVADVGDPGVREQPLGVLLGERHEVARDDGQGGQPRRHRDEPGDAIAHRPRRRRARWPRSRPPWAPR